MKVKDVIKMVEAAGYTFDRMKGDHRQYVKEGKFPITISGHLNDDMPKGTEGSIKRSLKK